jgi:hypothetical protein
LQYGSGLLSILKWCRCAYFNIVVKNIFRRKNSVYDVTLEVFP